MLSASQAPVEPALEGRRRTCRSWTAQHQRTAGSPAGRASARARVVKRWLRRLCRSATELMPRRAGHAYPYGAGTLDGTGACAGRAGCWEPLAPGSSFCWGPELQGSTSPSSSRSSTRRRAGRDRREVRRARAPAQGCPGPAPKPDRRPRCRWGLAPPERPRAFRSPRSYGPMFQPVGIWGGTLGVAFPRPWSESARKLCDSVTL